jgi:TatD DNase family protein
VPPVYVDSHCHLMRYRDPSSVLMNAERSRVVTVAVTETPQEFERQRTLLAESRFLRLALGLHPLRSARARERDLRRFLALARTADYIGEIGIDRSAEGKPTARRQTEVFEQIVGSDVTRARVMTVHSRGAAKDVVERLVEVRASAILHWFSGSASVVDAALAGGLYFSFNAPMTRSTSGHRLLAAVPPERVVTETDGPYARSGRRPSEPADVAGVVAWLARSWGATETEAAELVATNMAALAGRAREEAQVS